MGDGCTLLSLVLFLRDEEGYVALMTTTTREASGVARFQFLQIQSTTLQLGHAHVLFDIKCMWTSDQSTRPAIETVFQSRSK